MANELYKCYDNNSILYALIYRQSDAFIYNSDSASFVASLGELVYSDDDVIVWESEIVTVGDWETQIIECDIPLKAYGYSHFANFPTVAQGQYVIEYRVRAGTVPLIDDLVVGQSFVEWDGSQEITRVMVNTKIDTIDSLIDSITTNLSTANSNIAAILLSLNKVNNVYPAPQPEVYNPLGRL